MNSILGQLWILLLHATLLSTLASSTYLRGSETDRKSLLEFKAKVTADPLGVLSSWNESTHFCHWSGVTCGRRHRRVTTIALESRHLSGNLSPYIGNLSFLKILDLRTNNFSHEVPKELSGLFRLQILRLENNSFGGKIPTNISRCTNLIFLGLGNNNLSGKLPAEFGSFSKLQVLTLNQNNFVGEIPPSIGNLSSLEEIWLAENNLQGNIPSTFGRLKRLTVISLGVNQLSGTIPPSIFNLSSITSFAMPVNNLHGSLPPNLGLNFPNLRILVIFLNQFTGPIPPTISNASNLFHISISKNNFTGKIPSMANLKSLKVAIFQNNNLGSGKDDDLNFLSSLLNCTGLQRLAINDNNFGGVLPEFISNFSTNLVYLGLAWNRIRGSIPIEIGNLINLDLLGVEKNRLTGSIPRSVGKLNKLVHLYFNQNQLSGSIPSSLGNLTSLLRLNLAVNNLNGSIPSSLGECRQMALLFLFQNNLSGTIPKELMSVSSLSLYLDLSENYLTGSIPLEVGSLVNLGILDVSKNNLSGRIPGSLGNCRTLEKIFLQGNSLQGTVPPSLSSVRGLRDLDLSCNNLSGQIPQFLEGLALENLNISYNDFEGEVPTRGAFKNASPTSIMGNMKLCGGVSQLNLPTCTRDKSKKHRRLSSKLKLIIFSVAGLVGLIFLLSFLFLCWSRRTRKMPSSSMPMVSNSLPQVSYDNLLKATDGFSQANLIGVGSFGSVYKGLLGQDENVTTVAVKVFNLQKKGASKSFIAECEALRNIRHRNLCKIVTACSSVDFQGNDFKALVYEFMVNGSLEDWLHPAVDEERQLSLLQRINIAIDVASALDYVHNQCEVPIVHCDLKPSNILLDNDMSARIGDFGLARFLPENTHQTSIQTSSIGIKGTIGYAAPEYGMGSQVSTYGDVYSFGILLLELFTAKRPTDDMFKNGLDLHNFAKMALPEKVVQIGDPVLIIQINNQIVDPHSNTSHSNRQEVMRGDKIHEYLNSVVRLGVACSLQSPTERMDIGDVAAELRLVRDNLLGTGLHSTRHAMGPVRR